MIRRFPCNQTRLRGQQPKLRLIFHIGTGKTGTTSIQRVLSLQREQLKERGIWYLGLIFENAAVKKSPWQVATTDNVEFHALSPSSAEEQSIFYGPELFDKLHASLPEYLKISDITGEHLRLYENMYQVR